MRSCANCGVTLSLSSFLAEVCRFVVLFCLFLLLLLSPPPLSYLLRGQLPPGALMKILRVVIHIRQETCQSISIKAQVKAFN
jgi:hypothetical protein